MQELILYIKEGLDASDKYVKVDLYSDEVVNLTAKIQDVKNIEKIFTDFTKPFTLPASKKNNKLFKHWYNPDINGFNSNYKPDALIELNYQPFRKGVIKLNDVKLKNGKPEFYSITFTGNTVNLKTFLREEQLESLSWLDNFSQVASAGGVLASLKQGNSVTVDGVLYDKAVAIPLVTHTQRFIFNNTLYLNNPSNIAWNTIGSDPTVDSRGVFPEDVKYAIKVFVILKAIEKRFSTANGFRKNIVFSQDFFYATNPAIEKLYLWCHRRKGKAIGPGTRELTGFAETCTNIIGGSCNEITNPTGNWAFGNWSYAQGNLFWSPLQSTEIVTFKTKIIPGGNFTSTLYDLSILEDFNSGTPIALSASTNLTGVNEISVTYNNFGAGNTFSVFDAYNIYGNVSSLSDFEFQMQTTIEWQKEDQFGIPRNYASAFPSVQTNIDLLSDFIPTDQVPKIKVIEFLTGLFRMFNLTAYVDDFSDEIIIQPLDEFYASSTKTFDLTDLVNSSDHQVNEALPFTDIEFKYKDPKSILATEFNEINNRKYGHLGYSASATKEQKYNIELPFENMLFERLSGASSGGFTDIQQGTYITDDQNPAFGSPILFYIHQVDITNDKINFVRSFRPPEGEPVTPGTNDAMDKVMVPSNASEIGTPTVAPAFNINFGSEINSYTFTDYSGNNNSLFDKFYINYIRSVFDPRNRLFKFKAQLPLNFLLKFKLQDKVLVRDREFHINSINANLQTGQSTIELINLFDLDINNAIPVTTTTTTTTTSTTTTTTSTTTTTLPPTFNYRIIELDANCNQTGSPIPLQSNSALTIGQIISLNELGGCWEVLQPTGATGTVTIAQEFNDCVTCQGSVTTTTTTEAPKYYYLAEDCVTKTNYIVWSNTTTEIGEIISFDLNGVETCATIIANSTIQTPNYYFDTTGFADCNDCLGITTTTIPPTTTVCISGSIDGFVFWNTNERFDNGSFDLYPNKFAVMTIDIGVGDESPNCNTAFGNFLLSLNGGGNSLILNHDDPTSYPVPMATSGFAATWGPNNSNNGFKEYVYYLAGNPLGDPIKTYQWNLNLNQNPTGCDEYNGNADMSVVCYDYPVVVNSNADFFQVALQLETQTRSFELVSGTQFCKLRLVSTGVIVGATGFSWAQLTYVLRKDGVIYQQGVFEVDGPYGGFGSVDQKELDIILNGDQGEDGIYEITIELEMTTHPQNPPPYATASFELFTPAPTLN